MRLLFKSVEHYYRQVYIVNNVGFANKDSVSGSSATWPSN